MSIRVLLVDDHVMIREALRTLLERTPDIEVVGEASDGGEVEELVLALSPDVVVMDVSLPTISGIELPVSCLPITQRCRSLVCRHLSTSALCLK